MNSVEVRVHGIGDHGALSALGSGALLPAPGDPSGVETYKLPEIPADRDLLFVNWSRTSHRRARIVWYLALPFTLVNVAGHMTPPKRVAPAMRALHGGATVVMGIVLSLAAEAWLIILIETVLKYSRGAVEQDAVVAVLVVGVLLAVAAGVRAWRHRMPPLIGLLHSACFLALAGAVVAYRPAQLHHVGWPNECSMSVLRSTCRGDRLDAMTGFVTISLAVGLVTAALLTGTQLVRRTRSSAQGWAGFAGAAALLLVALLVIHTVGWVLRYSIDWISSYFTSGLFRTPRGLPPDGRLLLAATENEPVLIAVKGGMATFAPPLGRIIALPALTGLALVLAALAVVACRAPRSRRTPSRSPRERSARLVHDTVAELGELLPWILGLGVLLAVGLTLVSEPGQSAPLAVQVMDLLAIGMAVLLVVLVCFPGIRSALGTMADVAGFWPPLWHPLAGVSYRRDVVAGIRSTLDRQSPATVALVGHSQGSVLSAWLAHSRGTSDPRVHLVTCGSPLQSLYATFFPAYFDDAFFRSVRTNVASWSNFWRATDPIATELPSLEPGCNVELPDTTHGPLHGHGDYWTEPRLTSHITSLVREHLRPEHPGRDGTAARP